MLAGDVNLSNDVTAADAVLLCKYLATSETLTKEQAQRGDMNSDGKLNVIDLTLLKRLLLSKS